MGIHSTTRRTRVEALEPISVEEVRQALLDFKRTYNENWIVQRHGY
jgi:hypothetical protein